MNDSIKSIRLRRCMLRLRLAILATVAVFMSATNTYASWAIEIESKEVGAGATNVTLDFTVSWDIGLTCLTIPVIVRENTPGSFWAGVLPVDTADGTVHGVTWKWSDPLWPRQIKEVRPGPGCNPEGDIGYDGVSPDHFVVNALDRYTLPAESSGWTVLTIEFDVTPTLGSFEFDTACFTEHLPAIFMIDYVSCGTNHGPNGLNDATFTKGVITITESPCYCGEKGDVNHDANADPLDVTYLVNFVYKQLDELYDYNSLSGCPMLNGDVNCDDSVDPLDVTYLVNYVYKQLDELCQDRCNGGP